MGFLVWRRVFSIIALLFAVSLVCGCGGGAATVVQGEPGVADSGDGADSGGADIGAADPGGGAQGVLSPDSTPRAYNDDWQIRVANAAGEVLFCFTEAELDGFFPEGEGLFSQVYSTINNWPTERFYVAEGYSVTGLLHAAGLDDSVMSITFRAEDGYEATFTRGQLFSEQYYFPRVGEDGGGAEPVFPMIAYRWREGTGDLADLRDDKPIFIFGQRDPFEHSNPAFVVGVTEIVVDDAPRGTWQEAGTFPSPGPIEMGGAVKLQHNYFGLVKLFYTLDGSDPTPLSALYNPSTYQLELNRPIVVTEPVTIKVLVTGYGMDDSEVASFEFWPEG